MIKPCLKYIEELDIKKVFKPKAIFPIMFVAIIYLASVKLCGGINTSVRIFGDHGVLSVLLYMIVGMSGTVLYLTGFAIAENTSWLSWICYVFAYFGRHTMVLLASHIAVFGVVEALIDVFHFNLGYITTLLDVAFATSFGTVAGIAIEKLGKKNELIELLG